MAIFSGLAKFLVEKKKKYMKSLKAADCKAGCVDVELYFMPIKLSNSSTKDESNFIASKSFPASEKSSYSIPNTASMDSLVIVEFRGDGVYEGGEEHDENLPMKRDYSDFILQAEGELISHESNSDLKNNLSNYASEYKIETNEGITHSAMLAGELESDPGMEQTAFWASPVLKQSESSSKRSTSYSDHIKLSGNESGDFHYEDHRIPLSNKSSCSDDCLILQKHSSRHVLPSQTKNILWNLCLWSDMNLDKPRAPHRLALVHSTPYEKVGCSSDTYELDEEPDEKAMNTKERWVSFSLQPSSHDRVYSWINSLEDYKFCPVGDDIACVGNKDEGIAFPHQMEIGESSGKNHLHINPRAAEEVIQANNIIQSLNSFSSVAHFSGIGLKVIPSISAFGTLRSVFLSQNLIVHISPGCLPKNIHTLDLSRNKLSTIEGLKDLTRLRILNLSYNRISRIGHGLSSCSAIKELYLAGNRISEVEGLHRLLKLAVLDLGFNKITTARAFCQLVANYDSLFALNLLGNPIQSNAGDDQIRKAVVSILPHIRYLNKQPIKQHRARDVAANCVANASDRDGGWSSRRRPARRFAQGSGPTAKGKNGGRSKSKHQHSSSVRK